MSSTLNQLTIGMATAGAGLVEFFKSVQPGQRLKLVLDNGVSKAEGEVIVDENLDDRVAGRVVMEDGEDIGAGSGDEDDDSDRKPATPSAGAAGASVMAVIAGGKKD